MRWFATLLSLVKILQTGMILKNGREQRSETTLEWNTNQCNKDLRIYNLLKLELPYDPVTLLLYPKK